MSEMSLIEYLSSVAPINQIDKIENLEVFNIIYNNGFWMNTFNYLTYFQKNNSENILYLNKYPTIIYKDFETIPNFKNTTIEIKHNNTIEIIEWYNNKIINFVHYRFVSLNYNTKINKINIEEKNTTNNVSYLDFLNDDQIE
tara:strand:+ start:44 stop:469 length:426 start_codon:yes stop_codon:yes gene_type:complete